MVVVGLHIRKRYWFGVMPSMVPTLCPRKGGGIKGVDGWVSGRQGKPHRWLRFQVNSKSGFFCFFLSFLFLPPFSSPSSLSQLRSSTRTRRPTRVPRQRSTNALRLNTAKPLQLLGLHRNLLPKPNFPRRALDEADTVRVQRLMDRRSARLGAGDGNTSGGDSGGSELVPLAETFDNGGFHREFDPVERDEPDDVLRVIISITFKQTYKRRERKTHTQTQTIPIQPPLIPLIFVKPQSP